MMNCISPSNCIFFGALCTLLHITDETRRRFQFTSKRVARKMPERPWCLPGPGPRLHVSDDLAGTNELYELLGTSPEASPSEIRAAYCQQAKQTHPDRAPGSEEAFKAVHEAYTVLKDERTRRLYDHQQSPKRKSSRECMGFPTPPESPSLAEKLEKARASGHNEAEKLEELVHRIWSQAARRAKSDESVQARSPSRSENQRNKSPTLRVEATRVGRKYHSDAGCRALPRIGQPCPTRCDVAEVEPDDICW